MKKHFLPLIEAVSLIDLEIVTEALKIRGMKTLTSEVHINNKGFSLLETLISIGISSIIALSATYALVTSMEGMSHMKNMNLAEDAVQLVSGMLTDPNYCGLHFNGKSVPNSMGRVIEPDVVFKDMATATSLGTTDIFKAGQKYQNSLSITSVKLYVDSKIGTNRYVGSVRVEFKGSAGMVSQFTRSATLFLKTDATSKIIDCSQIQTSSVTASQYIKGQMYGHCKQDLDANFMATNASPAAWPMLTCPSSGAPTPTCDTGFSLSVNSVAQMNTRGSGFVNAIPLMADQRLDLRRVIGEVVDGDVYIATYGCVKN
ncbi:MAG: prepilin-type N-terminal cleavage/methylation domain-containing protein [Bdellovibrionaceae bacterium]|nr:prepilin-type N-terminal cleavage/methylation domain-containing protein [Pseudobdellovibrionaceae bacterium]